MLQYMAGIERKHQAFSLKAKDLSTMQGGTDPVSLDRQSGEAPSLTSMPGDERQTP